MPRETFERQLSHLEEELLILVSMVERALEESMRVLQRRDLEGSRRVIAGDQMINEKRYAVEAETLGLIATQQPMARDLRTLAAILEIATELERIGDYAKGIARINLMIGNRPLIKPLIDLPRLSDLARDMLHQAIDAFVRRDVEMARCIPEQDERVDSLYNQIYRELITYVVEDQRHIEQANWLLWAAHNLERTADRVSNICERTIFTVTGEMIEIGGSEEGIESLG